jgi:hypothetical protein
MKQLGSVLQESYNGGEVWPSLDPDNLYQDFCTENGTLDFVNTFTVKDQSKCANIGDYMTDYLNREDVQRSIYAVPTKCMLPCLLCSFVCKGICATCT